MKSKKVTERMGVYKSIDEVPSRRRLSNFEGDYADRDVWKEYVCDPETLKRVKEERTIRRLYRCGEAWKEFTHLNDCHHALVSVTVAESFFENEIDHHALSEKYYGYFSYIDRFYSWLLRRTHHPHTYHPIRMAVVQNDELQKIWDYKVQR